MVCSACGHENRESARFCENCGASQVLSCTNCQTELRSGARFCDSCGTPVDSDETTASEPPSATPPQPEPQPQVEAEPTSFADGRYEVTRFLGEGGKKKVYLAHDNLLDRDIAFALIKTEGLDEASRTRISREAQAMGRLGSHPHIVTVFDLGEESDQPFMVTELMGGGDVEGVVEDAEDGKLPLEQAISIAVETCRGLEFAHSRGIVHRDLKPGNVWLTADGVAKIGDFGLAVATDKSRLTQEGMMVGTVSYMPPEQAMGGEVTPRADLYSLGAMLYEMVAGRPPFLGDDNIAIIGQHINTPPVAPTWHRSDCPRPLEALIMRLLSKDPSQRPESAEEVRVALESLDLTDTDAIRRAQDEREINVLDSLAGDVFVGRQREMDDLKAAVEDVLSGRGRMVTLVGEPGIGKTRTAQELATYAGLRGFQVLWGRCYEEQGVPPYWPWVQAIRSYVRGKEPEELSTVMGSGAAEIAEVVSDVREQLPGLPRPQHMDSPESARFRLFDSISTFLRAASNDRPMMLVLDDLQWSDRPSLILLQFMTREMANSRILLMGTYRDVELNRQHPLAETLGDLNRESIFQRITLRGLTSEDVGRFIEVVSGLKPPADLISSVHAQTEGNPLFVTEVVRFLVQEGQLTQEQTRTRDSWEIRVPEGVREVIGRRLNRLSERCNETLAVAAVIGREFSLDQLHSVLSDPSMSAGESLTQNMLLDVLEEALAARIVEELPTSIGTYQFTHALMQEALVVELSLTRRVRLHGVIAESLERLHGNEAEANAAELVHHFSQAETLLGSEKLMKYSAAAGQQALDRNAYEEALSYFETAASAIDDETPDLQAGQILFGYGKAQSGTAQYIAGFDTLKEAYSRFLQGGNQTQAINVAQYPNIALWHPEFVTFVQDALDIAPNDSVEAGRISSRLGIGQLIAGNWNAARMAYEESIRIAQAHEDVSLEMLTLSRYASLEWNQLRIDEAVRMLERGLELSGESDDIFSEHQIHFVMALCANASGDSQSAIRHSKQCMRLATRLNEAVRLGQAYLVTDIAYLQVGDWAIARANSEAYANTPYNLSALSRLMFLEFQLGNVRRGQELLGDVTDEIDSSQGTMPGLQGGSHISLAGMITDDASTIERGQMYADRILNGPSPSGMAMVNARVNRSLVSVYQKDPDKAQLEYDFFSSHKGLAIEVTSTDRLLGLLARTLGKLDASAVHFEDALTFCRKAGYRPELAWSLHDYAEMLLERDEPGDQEKATSMLDEALFISTDLGMKPLMERILSKREILKA